MRSYIRNLYLSLFGYLKKPKPGVHIINSHFVKNSELDFVSDSEIFISFIEFLQKDCVLVRIEKAIEMILSGTHFNRPYVAFTFDDGFEECYSIIAPILESYDCNAAFFINSNYISSREHYQQDFNKRIKVNYKKPMNWENVKDLSKRGHIIGSHTCDHYNLANIAEEELLLQLEKDKNIIEAKLGVKCEYFAWPYGEEIYFSELALKYSVINFKYVFSGTNYLKYFSYEGKVINRRHLEPFWPKSHINYFLSVTKV